MCPLDLLLAHHINYNPCFFCDFSHSAVIAFFSLKRLSFGKTEIVVVIGD